MDFKKNTPSLAGHKEEDGSSKEKKEITMIVKNNQALVKNSSFPRQAAKALQIVGAGIQAVEVKGAVQSAKLPKLAGFENVYVVGFGKASAAMAEALEKRLGKRIAGGAVVSVRKAKTMRIRSFVGTHPYPSQKNVAAAKKILAIAERAGSNDLVIALVSGGGSSLLALPGKGLNISELRKTNELLIKSKARVDEINIVRKHLSMVKGGLLAKAAYPARVHALIISDAVGDDLETIASAATFGDRSTFKQAAMVLKKYKLWKRVPMNVRKRLTLGARGKLPETPKPGSKIFRKVKNEILLNNMVALKAMKENAKKLGLNSVIYSNTVQGEARNVGKKLVKAAGKRKRPIALLAGGETTVKVVGNGKGGRNQEMVLASLKELEKLEKAIFVSVGTDGIDGKSRAAGAIADSHTLKNSIKKSLNFGDFLRRNDSNSFFKKGKGEILTGPTGTNVMDLQLVLAWD
ncbi:MAG: DUF4147 domain-containing protein [Candidatus Diapherotrites archaeon]|uniref:DUF4147 domain-containing protein n=1 Tax=Candidatus Iainarchaeum sp. TaxID=3101447 RepID=A0A938YS68_9ARCH|nr:DUF4147 domain-containing protein [Candidatus Diapherotrites archaeon]